MHDLLIEQYLAGPQLLREAVAGMTDAELDAAPVAGRWSTRQVVCHLADFEVVGAYRLRCVIAEERPTLFGHDESLFAERLGYAARSVDTELQVIDVLRRQLGRTLETLAASAFDRVGVHSEAGPLTLRELLARVTEHIPHHVRFIAEKRLALGGRPA